jgi:predicted  nucleic acid-binding Zn-ribbon protein
MLSAYESIRSSFPNGLAVVPVMRDSCGGCFNVIPPQRQSEIRQRKKIVVCEHCGRILVDTDLNDSVKVKL